MPAGILEDYIDLDTLATECDVSRRTVERWVNATSPGLPVTRLGRRPLVHRRDLAEWLAARRTQANVPRTARGA